MVAWSDIARATGTWSGVGKKTAEASYYLREDGGYILREDGGRFLRQISNAWGEAAKASGTWTPIART